LKTIIDKISRFTRNSHCGIGNFDGIHRGHQEIVRTLKKLAGPAGKTGIITFIPLPFSVLKKAPHLYLTPRKEKEKIFQNLGVDFIYYFKFTRRFSMISPQEFVNLIATKIGPCSVVVGENFHFGKGRGGNAQKLKELARNLFSVIILPRVQDEGPISSTRIRELLLLGHLSAANRLLGREYEVCGTVIKGKGKGRRLGFPTINISPPREKLLPLEGVYKVRVMVGKKEFLGAMFCRTDIIEVHLINFRGNLYRKKVAIRFIERLRDIESFPDDESLHTAIARDIARIKDKGT